MNLFKITTANRERDDAAIDWIEDILKASERKSAAAGREDEDSVCIVFLRGTKGVGAIGESMTQ